MRRRTIIFVVLVVLAALVLPGSARPQALIIGTDGEAGDGSHFVSPIKAEQKNGDTAVAADVGSGNGSAATAGTQSNGNGGQATVGCAGGTASNDGSTLDASAGNCGGDGRAAGADAGRDQTGALAGVGCVDLGLGGSASGGLQVGSCKGARGGEAGGPGGGSGSGGSNRVGGASGGGGPSGGDGTSGSGSDTGGSSTGGAGGTAAPNGSGGTGQGNDSGLCGPIQELAGLTGPGAVPLWLLVLCAVGAFAGGLMFARRDASGASR
jgi:hypothetical protein